MPIVQNVGLEDGHLGLVGGDELDVRLGGAGVDSGELGQAQLVADGGDERVTNGIVSTGGAAGGDDDVNGSGGGIGLLGVAVGVGGITFLAAAGNKSEDHSDGQDEG